MNAGWAAGRLVAPVLFGELFTGAAGIERGARHPVAKLKSRVGFVVGDDVGPAEVAGRAGLVDFVVPARARGWRESLLASGPTSPQYSQPVSASIEMRNGLRLPIT